ncbi:AAA domain-containing protein [Kitasatospora sp. NPDC093806]|uniref:AAA domain-containing protein n=1 Tax=Kitasatospora sp. NPDC093806 TaxID=3155075 RepID=UPI003446B8D5
MSSHGTSTPDDALRVRQIFRYLAEAGESRVKPVRTLDQATHVLWLSEVPRETAGVRSFLETPADGEEAGWLTVRRPEQQPWPEPGQELKRWLAGDLTDYRRAEPPGLRESAEVPHREVGPDGTARQTVRTVDRAGWPGAAKVAAAHLDWVERWQKWATWRRAVAPLRGLYERLYRIHEEAGSLGESYELVLGFGYLTWASGGEPIRRHLLTARAVLSLDRETGTLTLSADPDQPSLALEEGMLDAGQKIRSEPRETILGLLEEAGGLTGPDGLELVHRALEAWTIAAHESGAYRPDPRQHRADGEDRPVVGFAPAVILRERSKRTNIEALHGIARQVEQGAAPTELLRFIAGADGGGTVADGSGGSGGPGADRETYFALPSNEEQRTIAERLHGNRMVVVQGPPGTGKTHTIANLVTDLLAHGQRVLITSHTARALKVLKDKLPASVRELCVSRTDDGLAAQQELRGSIQAILERHGRYEPRSYARRIAEQEHRLTAARRAQAQALAELRAIRERETYRHPAGIGDYQGTLQEIARRLAAEQPERDWLGPVPLDRPPIGAAEVLALLAASRAYDPAHRAATEGVEAVPERAELPGPAAFEQDVTAVREAEEGLATLRGHERTGALDEEIARLTPAQQDVLAAALEAFGTARTAAESRAADWAAPLLDEALTGQDWQLRGRHAATAQALDGARAAVRALGGARVDGLAAHTPERALTLATALRDGLAAGEKLRGPLGLKTRLRKEVGDFPEQVRVDGAPADTPAAAEAVLRQVLVERHLREVEREWGQEAPPWQAQSRRLAALEASAAVLNGLVELAARRAELITALAPAPVLTVRPWQRPETCAAARDVLRARRALRRAEEPRARLVRLEAALVGWADRPGTGRAPVRPLLTAVRDRDVEAYGRHDAELTALRASLELRAVFERAAGPVRGTLPDLAERLTDRPGDPAWDERLPRLAEAWAWSVWSARMRELTDPRAEEKQRTLLAEADDEIRITLEKLAADRSWDGCLRRLTDHETVALTSYQQSVGRIGKGTGKYAHRYRQQARDALRECQSAVPAWIMPLHQVTATVPMEQAGRFDVVIIDEASQSGPEALMLAWLGSRIIVVGDDKQVSPANIGLDHDQLFQLQNRLLEALPASRRNLFSPTASFFDIASGLAGGRGKLMLQEHFRCMPEIIGFSNELAYHGRLQPLRQYGADRLPPIRTVYAAGAFTTGTGERKHNRAEAELLVDRLAACCADPAYQGRSMGVITMLGSRQKQEIEDLLAERLPLEERQQRRIRVGNAEDFQGDERDVVFISLVVSPSDEHGPTRIGPFSSEAMQQRLNVAASRARDQVWLFHSFTSTELGATDLRRAYLDYCTRPAEEQDGLGLEDVGPDVRHPAFDSLFEQRVFLALRARRFRVRPQYPVGRYRIDLVVEGGTRRLAVECDGDAFHTEENADADAARQRELERVGWTFVRIRGSRFFLEPERALEPLWAELARLGIEPGAGTAPAVDLPAPEPTVLLALPAPAAEPTVLLTVPVPEPTVLLTPPAPAPTVVFAAPAPLPATAPRGGRRRVSVASHERARQEAAGLAERLAGPSAGAEAEARDEERLAFLRHYLSLVTPDPALAGNGVVLPGTVVGLEHRGATEVVRYLVSALPTAEAARISPHTDLGAALLWAEVGEEIAYAAGRDGGGHAVVRSVED